MRTDMNTATLAGLICHAGGIKNQEGRTLNKSDFLQWLAEEEEEATVDELARVLGKKG
jgi:hypothetical protein